MPDLQITTCVSKTGVTCCVKEAKAVGDNGILGREIRILRKLAHVRPAQPPSGLTETESSIAVHHPVH